MVKMIENIAFLQTRAVSVCFLMSILFPRHRPPAMQRRWHGNIVRRGIKPGADMPHSGISAPNGDVLLRANDSEPCLAAMDLLSLLIIFFERRAAPQSGAAVFPGGVFAFKIKPFYLSAFVFFFFSPLRPRGGGLTLFQTAFSDGQRQKRRRCLYEEDNRFCIKRNKKMRNGNTKHGGRPLAARIAGSAAGVF